jgi:hypothetical protein
MLLTLTITPRPTPNPARAYANRQWKEAFPLSLRHGQGWSLRMIVGNIAEVVAEP